jgi:hypothetical protein
LGTSFFWCPANNRQSAVFHQGHISPLFQPVIKKMLKNFLSEACITRRSDLPLRPLLKKGEVQT